MPWGMCSYIVKFYLEHNCYWLHTAKADSSYVGTDKASKLFFLYKLEPKLALRHQSINVKFGNVLFSVLIY